MTRWQAFVLGSLVAATAMAQHGRGRDASAKVAVNPVVGTWLVKDTNAPFPFHLYVFNADGTMQQANPDAGDPRGSDSDGKGVWVADGPHIRGKWVEVSADRATHEYTGRLEVSFDLTVRGDSYTGTETVRSYDAQGTLRASVATPAPLEGSRVTLP